MGMFIHRFRRFTQIGEESRGAGFKMVEAESVKEGRSI